MNIAFIDGQNLYYALKSNGLKIDYKRFRVYLKDKYNIEEAYYFLGFIKNEEGSLYEGLQKAGFIRLILKQALCLFWQFLAATCFVNAHRCAASARSPQLRFAQKLSKMHFVLFENKSVKFKAHNELMAGKKKGNVDTDIVFEVMKKLIESPDDFEKVLIVSGDGDYKRLLDYLIERERFERILLPTRERASSLYKIMSTKYYAYVEDVIFKFKYPN